MGFNFSVVVIEILTHHAYMNDERKCVSLSSFWLLFTQWILRFRCVRSTSIISNGFQLFCRRYRDLHASCIHQWRAQICVPFFIQATIHSMNFEIQACPIHKNKVLRFSFSVGVIEIFTYHACINGECKCVSLSSYRLLFTQWILRFRCVQSKKITANGFQLFCRHYRDLHA